ncbi:casein kinase ii subunit beta [Anaeramoeba ignava]|uniref:Casein kinase II subunit beta n=1 Tax=Anaeramoeba ignava TaxID=1746090 RepID=A0A9Q0L8R8_ANAIG|nr:casein kinase ii subunit beta [Anaeramoeba ignava]|eukprot:Anaeramoba_ignava/a89830_43.p1 GENE.a89830_43~~a89830_43.p1  ORF type:complete len:224 (-),score=78.76 a89830_43:87-758(-)
MSIEQEQPKQIINENQPVSWVSWFCSLKGNEFFCQVDESYINDNFNLTGLSSQIPYYNYAISVIRDEEIEDLDDLTEEQQEVIESAAEMLYGLIHSRYILTPSGLQAMAKKFQNAEFGKCPHFYCEKQPCLPVGQSESLRQDTVKLFCPRCQEIYFPKLARHSNIDGAYFGTTFPHFFLKVFPQFKPKPLLQKYTPQIFGFRLHKSVRNRKTVPKPKTKTNQN